MRWSVFFTLLGTIAILGFVAVKWTGYSYTPNIDRQARVIAQQKLEDADGKPVSFGAMQAIPKVLVFGYMSCPDVCPTSLAYLARELDLLGADRHLIRPFFVSVDPDRDRGPRLAAFTRHFSNDIVGLTGSLPALKGLAQGIGAFVETGSKDPATGGYVVNHSASFYILDQDSRLVASLPPPHARGALAALMAKAIHARGPM